MHHTRDLTRSMQAAISRTLLVCEDAHSYVWYDMTCSTGGDCRDPLSCFLYTQCLHDGHVSMGGETVIHWCCSYVYTFMLLTVIDSCCSYVYWSCSYVYWFMLLIVIDSCCRYVNWFMLLVCQLIHVAGMSIDLCCLLCSIDIARMCIDSCNLSSSMHVAGMTPCDIV